jgi:hypothetical protein
MDCACTCQPHAQPLQPEVERREAAPESRRTTAFCYGSNRAKGSEKFDIHAVHNGSISWGSDKFWALAKTVSMTKIKAASCLGDFDMNRDHIGVMELEYGGLLACVLHHLYGPTCSLDCLIL